MDEFIMFVLKTLGIKNWSGIDMADIYEKALSLAPQKSAHNSDYAKCLEELKTQVKWNGWEDPYITDILKKHFA